jgi:ABC-2 type transport system ATP-binding protein
MLEAHDLTKRYGAHTALNGLTLTVAPGEVFCLLGANGAGKTTTINLFLNFIEPTSGTAHINGLDVTKAPLETKKHVAYIPEQVRLYRNLASLCRPPASRGPVGGDSDGIRSSGDCLLESSQRGLRS